MAQQEVYQGSDGQWYRKPLRAAGFGAVTSSATPTAAEGGDPAFEVSPALQAAGYVASVAGTAVGAYHGYKRNRGSVGWAVGWAFLGGLFPVIVIPIALAQGVGKPAKR